ncbi:MAG: hypothetical protein ACUVQM_04650 [Candidatus Hadarchaeaceae archaeon]
MFKIKSTLEPPVSLITGIVFGYGRRHQRISYYLTVPDWSTGNFEIVGNTSRAGRCEDKGNDPRGAEADVKDRARRGLDSTNDGG